MAFVDLDLTGGSLRERPLAALLLAARQHSFTGMLRLESSGAASRLMLRDGAPVAARMGWGFKPLGEVLVQNAIVELETLDRALPKLCEGHDLPTVLMEIGALDEAALAEGLHRQLREHLRVLAATAEGRFEARAEPVEAHLPGQALDATWAFAEALAAPAARGFVFELLERLGSRLARVAGDALAALAPLGLEAADRAAVERLRAPGAPEDLVAAGVSVERAEWLVALLLALGLAEAVDPAAESAARAERLAGERRQRAAREAEARARELPRGAREALEVEQRRQEELAQWLGAERARREAEQLRLEQERARLAEAEQRFEDRRRELTEARRRAKEQAEAVLDQAREEAEAEARARVERAAAEAEERAREAVAQARRRTEQLAESLRTEEAARAAAEAACAAARERGAAVEQQLAELEASAVAAALEQEQEARRTRAAVAAAVNAEASRALDARLAQSAAQADAEAAAERARQQELEARLEAERAARSVAELEQENLGAKVDAVEARLAKATEDAGAAASPIASGPALGPEADPTETASEPVAAAPWLAPGELEQPPPAEPAARDAKSAEASTAWSFEAPARGDGAADAREVETEPGPLALGEVAPGASAAQGSGGRFDFGASSEAPAAAERELEPTDFLESTMALAHDVGLPTGEFDLEFFRRAAKDSPRAAGADGAEAGERSSIDAKVGGPGEDSESGSTSMSDSSDSRDRRQRLLKRAFDNLGLPRPTPPPVPGTQTPSAGAVQTTPPPAPIPATRTPPAAPSPPMPVGAAAPRTPAPARPAPPPVPSSATAAPVPPRPTPAPSTAAGGTPPPVPARVPPPVPASARAIATPAPGWSTPTPTPVRTRSPPPIPPTRTPIAFAVVPRPVDAPAPSVEELALARAIESKAAVVAGEDPFARLGLARTASREQAKEAYLNLVKTYHPDRLPSSLESLRGQVEAIFQALHDANETLQDDARRAACLDALERPQAAYADESEQYRRLGEAALRKREFAKAAEQFAKAFEMGRRPVDLAHRAWSIYLDPAQRQRLPEIKDMLDEALKADRGCDRAAYWRGVIARVEGDIDRAERYFRMATDANPQNAEARTELRLIEIRRRKPGGLFG